MDKYKIITEYFLDEISVDACAIKALTRFVTMEEMESEGDSEDTKDRSIEKPLFSYALDYPYILSAFLKDYQIDLTHAKMHWWKFRMLFDGLSENTEIKQRIMYRGIQLDTVKDPDERKRIQKIKIAIALPEAAFTDYDIGNAFS